MLVYLVLIGVFIGFVVAILIMIKWFFNDYLICDEGHPEKPFKCTRCEKRY